MISRGISLFFWSVCLFISLSLSIFLSLSSYLSAYLFIHLFLLFTTARRHTTHAREAPCTNYLAIVRIIIFSCSIAYRDADPLCFFHSHKRICDLAALFPLAPSASRCVFVEVFPRSGRSAATRSSQKIQSTNRRTFPPSLFPSPLTDYIINCRVITNI